MASSSAIPNALMTWRPIKAAPDRGKYSYAYSDSQQVVKQAFNITLFCTLDLNNCLIIIIPKIVIITNKINLHIVASCYQPHIIRVHQYY